MRYALIFLLLVILNPVIKACSCFNISFCETADWGENIIEVMVIKKYLGEQDEVLIDLEILEVHLGEVVVPDGKLTIVESGTSCDIGIESLFEVGDKLIITSPIGEYAGVENPSVFFFQCGVHFLRISGGNVIGNVSNTNGEEVQMFSYSRFVENVENLCALLPLRAERIQLMQADGNLVLKNDHTFSLAYTIYDMAGKKITAGMIDARETNHSLVLDWPGGVYFAVLEDEGELITKKVVIL